MDILLEYFGGILLLPSTLILLLFMMNIFENMNGGI